MNTTSNTRLWLTTQVGQDHTTTGVLLALGTNNQLHGPKNATEHQPRASLTYTGQAGEHHRSDRPLLVEPGNFHRKAPTPVRPVKARKPQIYQTGLPSSKLTQTRNSGNTGQQWTHPKVHPSKTQHESAPVRLVRGTRRIGVTWALGSTPSNPTPELPNHTKDLHKTLGIVGTPHGHSIAKILSTKTW
jgi:hypothetical protein